MEEWRSIKDFEGLYEVSNYGRVKSLDRYITCKNGVRKPYKGRILFQTKSKIDKKAHLPRLRVQLWKNNKEYSFHIHRLVASAFIPNPLNKPTVNHIDGNPMNNNLENLEWATYSENQKHAYKYGLIKPTKGLIPHNAKSIVGINLKTNETIYGRTSTEICKQLGVSPSSVTQCCRRNTKSEKHTCKGYILKYE